MYGLFWKLFLWFWAATVAMGATIAFTTAQLGGEKIPPMIERAKEQFTEHSAQAVDVLRRHGLDGLRRWLEDPSHTSGMRLYVLDAGGRDMLGNGVPSRVRNLALRGPPAGFPGANERRWHRYMVRHVAVPGEGFYHVVARFRPPHPVLHLFSPPVLLLALLVSAVVCIGLARYLSSPVRKLRVATRQLAAGNLDVRVGDTLVRGRDEMSGLGQDFDLMAERIQALVESQRRLLRDVSHELRSPLARLQAALGLARRHSEGRAVNELNRIEREAERLNELIGEVLSLARLASGDGDMERGPVGLGALLESVAADARFEAGQSGRRVELVQCEPLTVTGNAELLYRAIENVVRNALRYTAESSAVELALVRAADGPNALVTVRDHGPGIDEALMHKVFEPFFRASDARDRESGGHGLGLAIARRAVELHGGSITARNESDGGLTVSILLPLEGEGR